jgi:ubiquinone/menaquinone biosynthesis C-methylase UbiE
MSSTIAGIYDALVADSYDQDPFGILGFSQGMALQQVVRELESDMPVLVDVGTGTGEMLVSLRRQYPHAAELVGIDVSARMLELAGGKLLTGNPSRVQLIQDDALNVGNRFNGRFDLALSHFILNYVALEPLAGSIRRALRPGGLWSLVTTSGEAFRRLQELSAAFISHADLRSQCLVPESFGTLDAQLARLPFQPLYQHVLAQQVTFGSFEHLWHFAVHSGWFASQATASVTDEKRDRIRDALAPLFPLTDEVKVGVRLLRAS